MAAKRFLISGCLALGVAFSATAAAEPGFIGLQVQGMSPAVAEALGIKQSDGAMVRDVALGSPADVAGFRRGDLILSFNGKEVDTFEELTALAAGLKAGQTATVRVLRASGEAKLKLTAQPWPEGRKVERGSFAAIDALGVTLAALTQKVRDRLALRWGTTGVAVTLVDPKKDGHIGLRRGDLILQVNQKVVWDPAQVVEAYSAAKSAGRASVLVLVEGGDGFRFVLLPVL